MIVPFPAGGPVDTLARIMAERMRASLGQPIIVENISRRGRQHRRRPRRARGARRLHARRSASGARTSSTARSTPLPYDRARRFRAGRAAHHRLATDRDQESQLPANDLKELDRLAEGQPDKASAGTVGVGSPSAHLRRPIPERHRHALPVRALSRRRAGHAGSGGRQDRPRRSPTRSTRAAAGPRRHHQGPRLHRQGAAACRAGHSDRRGGRVARLHHARSGMRSGDPRARRRISSRGSMPR